MCVHWFCHQPAPPPPLPVQGERLGAVKLYNSKQRDVCENFTCEQSLSDLPRAEVLFEATCNSLGGKLHEKMKNSSIAALLPRIFRLTHFALGVGFQARSDGLTMSVPVYQSRLNNECYVGPNALSAASGDITPPAPDAIFPEPCKGAKHLEEYTVCYLPNPIGGATLTMHESSEIDHMGRLQVYFQGARYSDGPKKIGSCRDVSGNGNTAFGAMRRNVGDARMRLAAIYQAFFINGIMPRIEVAVVAIDLSAKGITRALNVALAFVLRNLVAFDQTKLLEYSMLQSSAAHLAQSACLDALIHSHLLSDRLANLAYVCLNGSILDGQFSGKFRSSDVASCLALTKLLGRFVLPGIPRSAQRRLGLNLPESPLFLSPGGEKLACVSDRAAFICEAMTAERDVPCCGSCGMLFASTRGLHQHLSDEKGKHNTPATFDGDYPRRSATVNAICEDMQKQLTPEQRRVPEALLKGVNVCVAAHAGTGKTLLVNACLGLMSMVHNVSLDSDAIVTLAGNNNAAALTGGWTLNSWAGIGVGETEKTVEELFDLHLRNEPAMARARAAKFISFDEGFYTCALLMLLLERVLRHAHRHEGCTNGLAAIHLLVVGDHFQLVTFDSDSSGYFRRYCGFHPYFESEHGQLNCGLSFRNYFEQSGCTYLTLTKSMRQSDPIYLADLTSLRGGDYSETLKAKLETYGQRVLAEANTTIVDKLVGMQRRKCVVPGSSAVYICLTHAVLKFYEDENLAAVLANSPKLLCTIKAFDSFRDAETGLKKQETAQAHRDVYFRHAPHEMVLVVGGPIRVQKSTQGTAQTGTDKEFAVMIPPGMFGVLESVSGEGEKIQLTFFCKFSAGPLSGETVHATVGLVEYDIKKSAPEWVQSQCSHRLASPIVLGYGCVLAAFQGNQAMNLIFDLHGWYQHKGNYPWMKHGLYVGASRVFDSAGILFINLPDVRPRTNELDRAMVKLDEYMIECRAKYNAECEAEMKNLWLTLNYAEALQVILFFFLLIRTIPLSFLAIETIDYRAQDLHLGPGDDTDALAAEKVRSIGQAPAARTLGGRGAASAPVGAPVVGAFGGSLLRRDMEEVP